MAAPGSYSGNSEYEGSGGGDSFFVVTLAVCFAISLLLHVLAREKGESIRWGSVLGQGAIISAVLVMALQVVALGILLWPITILAGWWIFKTRVKK